MNTKSRKSPAPKSNGEAREGDNVDKIRDILFGNQMREVEQRFASLEKSLARDLAAIRKENAMQIDSLKTYIDSEIEILGGRVANEEKSRIERDDSLDEKLKLQLKQLDKKIADLTKSLDKSARDINKKILQQTQDFGNELASQIGMTRDRMDGQREELFAAKVDKAALSEMLNTLALQINDDGS